MKRSCSGYGSRVVAGLLAMMLTACGAGSGDDEGRSGGGGSPQELPVATAVGEPVGEAVSEVLGPAGGSISSADGRVTLTVPAGALTSDTTISMQPIANHAHAGIGGGVRLGPEGQLFADKVRLTFRYDESDLRGTDAQLLGVAFQRDDRLWQWVENPQVDTEARTVTVETHHFSDWSLVAGSQLRPLEATVEVGNTVRLQVTRCYVPLSPLSGPTGEEPLGFPCLDDPNDFMIRQYPVEDWSVNGVVGGSSVTGTVAGGGHWALFTAPDTVPNPPTVAVSAVRRYPDSPRIEIFVSNITIIDRADYVGTVTYESEEFTATANVSWTLVNDAPGVRTYAPSGTMDLHITMEQCDPYDATYPISTDYPVASAMIVFREAGGMSNEYSFVFRPAGEPVTLSCGGRDGVDRYTMQWDAASEAVIAVGMCEGEPVPTYTEESILSGTYSCPAEAAGGGFSAGWEFKGRDVK